ncbi:hypothetical protein MJA45_08350 [Paenibacillus aurantius]|uniref:Uncharacterized protein n=1 Tax=Paenibacillus aurantius TaxID=2918900 RepID=A0AA96LHE4_9BACL|nr:hypothetical protein [Paenibacillus aurantius]WNQ13023.1 hypothetical protein MJA45_08350 [Paenibacillus aurantius]
MPLLKEPFMTKESPAGSGAWMNSTGWTRYRPDKAIAHGKRDGQ